MENEVKEVTPVIPGETVATEAKEAVETAENTYKQNLMINNFPRELYDKMFPAFESWNAKRMPKLKFGHYVISLLGDEEGTAQTIANLKSKIAEQSSEMARLESLLSEGTTNNELVVEWGQKLSTLEEEYDVLLELKASVELENKDLHAKVKELSSRPAPVTSAPVISGQYSEKAVMLALGSFIKQVAGLTKPGIFNKFQSLDEQDLQTLFNSIYVKALQA